MFSISIYLYLSIHLSTYLPISISILIYLYIYIYIYIAAAPPARRPRTNLGCLVYPSIYIYIDLSIYIYILQRLHLPDDLGPTWDVWYIHLSISIYPCIHLSTYIYIYLNLPISYLPIFYRLQSGSRRCFLFHWPLVHKLIVPPRS